jgi:hypothetical protein
LFPQQINKRRAEHSFLRLASSLRDDKVPQRGESRHRARAFAAVLHDAHHLLHVWNAMPTIGFGPPRPVFLLVDNTPAYKSNPASLIETVIFVRGD